MIYLDYNATTPLCAPARAAMEPYLEQHFGNPSSIHRAGREARAAIDNARDQLADLLDVRPNELIFTSGGTEANNLALLGLARQLAPNGKHLISNRAEHHAVLRTLEYLQKREGFEVTWLDLSPEGLIDPDQLKTAIRPETILVSIMTANNETGVIQPLEEIAEICRARGVLLHSDMVQSFGKMPGSLTNVNAAAFAAHKFYGPKGAGLLYLRAGLPLAPVQFGGAHEGQRRPGTENVAAIAGMAAAARFITENPPDESELRDKLWRGIASIFPQARLNGGGAPRLGNTLNLSFPGHDSETLLMALDLEGICASSGSACMVGSVVASHVLLAMGLPVALAASAVRFSLGKENSAAEIEETIAAFARILQRQSARANRPQHALV
ncbi:MAG TPA: cysteine desulfurase family protein [Chthoniobacterales bacterium]|jgi:cysteine desulfurase|nr:cysteine desulfurase family protein [Chthoniobacterales bacterium]